jgi:hypothetical protein
VSHCFRLIAVEFARFPIRFLVRKPFDMGIAGDKPRQTTSLRDRAIASRVASSSTCVASASASSDAALAASSFLVLRLRLGGSDEVRAPSRMMRAPLLRLGDADGGFRLTVLGVDAEDRDADLVADPEETDAIRRGI